MTTEVVILAQGTQQRMGAMREFKQLLPLPACGGRPIVARTIHQVTHLLSAAKEGADIHLVAWLELATALTKRAPDFVTTSLLDPGNSSLKGIQRYLVSRKAVRAAAGYDRSIVLLGDVVYSWACLEQLFDLDGCDDDDDVFAISHDLSPGGGELWGLGWRRAAENRMLASLGVALEKHPPYQEYQPGQMRRWYYARMARGPVRVVVTPPSDYIMDVDLPEHVPLLGPASVRAAKDDDGHFIAWGAW